MRGQWFYSERNYVTKVTRKASWDTRKRTQALWLGSGAPVALRPGTKGGVPSPAGTPTAANGEASGQHVCACWIFPAVKHFETYI